MKHALNSTKFHCIQTQGSFASTAILLTMILTLSACKTTAIRHTSPSVARPVIQGPIDQIRDPRIQLLLEEAYYAFIDSRLTTPVEDNAYYRY